MVKIKSLENHTEALQAVADFKEKNAKVFEALDSLNLSAQETEDTLKADVRDNHKVNISNGLIKVTYSPAFRKGYSYDIINDKATPTVKKVLREEGAITHAVDKKIFEDLVEQGVIPIQLKQDAFEEEEMSPRVMIKEVKKDEQK